MKVRLYISNIDEDNYDKDIAEIEEALDKGGYEYEWISDDRLLVDEDEADFIIMCLEKCSYEVDSI